MGGLVYEGSLATAVTPAESATHLTSLGEGHRIHRVTTSVTGPFALEWTYRFQSAFPRVSVSVDVVATKEATVRNVQLDLQLEMARAAVEPRARVVDFSSAQGHESVAADANPFEGQLLDLHPDPEVILPRHPAAVIHRDPRQRRVRRQPVVRVGDDGILCDIERALAMHDAGDE
jgi:hypothetical protein